MVSQSEQVPVTTPTGTTVTDDRGIRQQAAYPVYQGESVALQYRSFWGAVIAGSLIAISISLLSYALMFGCNVGVYNPTGAVTLGWGAAVWIVITSCIALLIGGYVSSALTRPVSMGWLYGFSVWGLTVPLSFVLAAIISAGAGAAVSASQVATPVMHAAYNPSHLFTALQLPNGVAWTLFTSLICGLIFGLIGGMSGAARSAASR